MSSLCGLDFSVQITGDCSNTNSGAFSIYITGEAPDFTIQFISPTTDVYYLGPGVTATTFSSLSSGTYVFEVIDTCLTAGTPTIGSIYISSGTTVSCIDIENTSNFLDNGAITAQTSNLYAPSSFYLYDFYSGFTTSGQSLSTGFTFTNLSASTYYVIADDGGGCTGQSETVIIKSSTTFDYGFYVVSDSACRGDNGKIFITGLTGQQPYTYLWSNGETTSSITGLTATGYTVTVTDKTGAIVIKGTSVPQTPTLNILSITPYSASCYTDDGRILIVITGGTAPYNYILSNGMSNVSYAQFQNFIELPAGDYTVTVIDSDFCSTSAQVSVLTPRGFNVISTTVKNSFCDTSSGSISISLIGGSPNFTYSLSGSNGTTKSQTTNVNSYTFSNLYAGEYYLTITDLGTCVYNELITVNSINGISINVEPQDATFRGDDGSVLIYTNSGAAPFTYKVSGQPTITKSDSSVMFRNLKTGSYLASVTDNSGCTVNENFYIGQVEPVDFLVYVPPIPRGKKGSIEVYITKGTPPFQVEWSQNVKGQTGLTITDLSAGTYSVTVKDVNGSTQTRSANVSFSDFISSYLVYNVCDNDINQNGTIVKKGLREMLVEGYLSLTQDDINCILNSAVFNTNVIINGDTYQSSFYTSNSLDDFPFDNDFYLATETILLSIDGIDSVDFNSNTNQVRINTGCSDQTVSLIDQQIIINVVIQYDISCENCGGNGQNPAVGLDFAIVSSDVNTFAYDTQGRYLYSLPQLSDYPSSLGIARDPSNTKLWILDITGTLIYEYDIENSIPFQVSFNRQITLSGTLSRSLVWYNTTNLISCADSSQYLLYIDIDTGLISNGIFLSTTPSTVVSKTILINSLSKIILVLTDIVGYHLLVQFDSYGNTEAKTTLPASTNGYTMFEDNGIFYIVNLDDLNVYSVEPTYPYNINFCYVLETPQSVSYLYMSQINSYITTNFT